MHFLFCFCLSIWCACMWFPNDTYLISRLKLFLSQQISDPSDESVQINIEVLIQVLHKSQISVWPSYSTMRLIYDQIYTLMEEMDANPFVFAPILYFVWVFWEYGTTIVIKASFIMFSFDNFALKWDLGYYIGYSNSLWKHLKVM